MRLTLSVVIAAAGSVAVIEREQTLNQLLVEMDGFGPNEGVIIMAASNRRIFSILLCCVPVDSIAGLPSCDRTLMAVKLF